jgi:hypothetical protein
MSTGSGGGGGGDDDDVPGGPDDPGGDPIHVYAHSASTLYRVDPDTLQITKIAAFGWSAGSDEMTDLAVDKNGGMIGVSETRVYRVDATTAACTVLSSSLQGSFNGLSYVPAEMLGLTGDDILVGTRGDDGIVDRIDPMTGAVTHVGDMGSSFSSSGDLVAVVGFGTVQTTIGSQTDVLAKLAPLTFRATAAGAATGFRDIWGVAFWGGKVFGFTQQGQFITIDPTSGVATLVQSGGPAWWGAAVSTLAPVIL